MISPLFVQIIQLFLWLVPSYRPHSMNTVQNQDYTRKLAFLGHTMEQDQADPDSLSCWSPHQQWINALGCWGKYLLQRQLEIITINSILASRTWILIISIYDAVWGFRKKTMASVLLSHLYNNLYPNTPPTNTFDKFQQVQLNHLRWAKRSRLWNFVSMII